MLFHMLTPKRAYRVVYCRFAVIFRQSNESTAIICDIFWNLLKYFIVKM